MAPAPNIPPFNVAFTPRPSVMEIPYTNGNPSTITPENPPKNIVSHAVFLKDSEPLDPSFRRILESPAVPTYLPIHVRSITDTRNLENDIANTKPVQGEVQLQPGLLAAIIVITSIVLLGLLFIGLFGFDKYLSYRKKVEMKKQQEEESSNNAEDAERMEKIQKGELTEIDLGDLGVAVVEHVEYADVESVKEVAKKGPRSGPGWRRFWR
jgi:hypothetical protein